MRFLVQTFPAVCRDQRGVILDQGIGSCGKRVKRNNEARMLVAQESPVNVEKAGVSGSISDKTTSRDGSASPASLPDSRPLVQNRWISLATKHLHVRSRSYGDHEKPSGPCVDLPGRRPETTQQPTSHITWNQ